jgi:hypothetical protein
MKPPPPNEERIQLTDTRAWPAVLAELDSCYGGIRTHPEI